MALNPEEIAACYTERSRYSVTPWIILQLKSGEKLRLWSYNKSLKTVIADIDVAMRERQPLLKVEG
jgi:hypothetical protein